MLVLLLPEGSAVGSGGWMIVLIGFRCSALPELVRVGRFPKLWAGLWAVGWWECARAMVHWTAYDEA